MDIYKRICDILRIATVITTVVFSLCLKAGSNTEPAGEALFIVGTVHTLRAGQNTPIKTGDAIFSGDTLITGNESHLQVKFADGGLISLRPNTSVLLESYHFSPDKPLANKIKLNLQHGVMRSATGAAGQQNKQSFRINTPIAAIGIRGTDFVTFASDQLVKIDLYKGGVVASPFNSTCLESTLTPCSGENSAELFANIPDAMLEIHAGQGHASVVEGGETPDEISPPHPNEFTLFEALVSHTQNRVQDQIGLSSPGAESYEDGLDRAERYLGENPLVQQAFSLGDRQPDKPLATNQELTSSNELVWGRWSTYAGQDPSYQKISDLLRSGRQYAVLNSVFALLEKTGAERALPGNGTVSFRLNSYEAYIKKGASLEAAGISNPALLVDFDSSKFATRLDVHADSLPGVVHVLGAGDLTEQGFFHSDADSLSKIDGVFTNNATEAGLLFDYQISPGVNATGATHWINNGPINE